MNNMTPRLDSTPNLRVGIILARKFTLSAFALLVDHLRLAADRNDNSRPIRCQWTVMSEQSEPVRSSCGIPVSREAGLRSPSEFDYIVVVGGLLQGNEQVGEQTLAYLRQAASLGVPLVGICTGVFVLCRAGVMKNRLCCVSWYHRQDFIEEFPDHAVISDRLFIADRNRISCSGGAGTADMACSLIEKHFGKSTAQKASHVLLLERQAVRQQNLLQPTPPLMKEIRLTTNAHVKRAAMAMEQNMNEPVSIGVIAEQLGLSPRHLVRLFQTEIGMKPTDFYRLIRLRYARALLRQGDMSITEIAIETGFSDCAHFSRQFKARFGLTPTELRLMSGAGGAYAPLAPSQDNYAGVRLFEEA
ncbi:GlxA family transcriptional regulator [Acetobacter sp. TBRC 12305]|uniref:GlxA family transcriptional regulator n=1 Tax=Acetobacter garciniae TaxID=2817435 RepID=A0A939HLE2_9PROT|nr:GlxA family transcriptional regulator [Acetobacter garciniae]MBO1326593.1 GlxA family transcriptional regulator [Acetobacter garciniae]MBX0346224.1 GlxA family transcriptional regulator [Acetobacter garciniae]